MVLKTYIYLRLDIYRFYNIEATRPAKFTLTLKKSACAVSSSVLVGKQKM